jgi:tetratricopeptide (TPR) repeat protein
MSEDIIFYYPDPELREIERINQERDEKLARSKLEKFISRTDLDEETLLQARFLQSWFLVDSQTQYITDETYDESQKIAEEVFLQSEKLKIPILEFDSLFLLLRHYRHNILHRGDYDSKKTLKRYKELQSIFTAKLEKIRSKDGKEYLRRKALFLYETARIMIYSDENRIEDALELIHESAELSEEIDYKKLLHWNLSALGRIYEGKGLFEESKKYMDKNLRVCEQTGYVSDIGGCYYDFSYYYNGLGDLEKAHEYLLKFLATCEETNDLEGILDAYFNIGNYHLRKGESEKALFYFNNSLVKFTEIGDLHYIPMILGQIGKVYENEGNLDAALENTQKAYEMASEHKSPYYWNYILRRMAYLNLLFGKLDSALQYINEILESCKEEVWNQVLIQNLSIKGQILWYMGLKEESIKQFEKGLKIAKKIDRKDTIAQYLSSLIRFNVEQDKMSVAKKYYNEIELLKTEVKIKPLRNEVKLAEALLKSRSNDLKEKLKAEILFEQLIEEIEIQFPTLIDVYVSYCEYLLKESQKTENQEYLDKLLSFAEKLIKITKDKESYIIQTQILILQSKILLLTLKIDRSRSVLIEALKIAQENHLESLIQSIIKQQELISEKSIVLNKLKDKDANIIDKANIVDVEESIKDIKQSVLNIQFKHTL